MSINGLTRQLALLKVFIGAQMPCSQNDRAGLYKALITFPPTKNATTNEGAARMLRSSNQTCRTFHTIILILKFKKSHFF